MNIAVVGLAFTHPYSYTKILHQLGHRVTHVWDDTPTRLAEFAERFGVTPVNAIEEIPIEGLDGVLATSSFPNRVDHAVYFLERGLPVYMSKPMMTSLEHIGRLQEAVTHNGSPVMGTSVLRYAPAVAALREHLVSGRLGTLVSARAISAHDVGMYMKEPNIWQDDPQRGGGTIITMGLHAVEPLVALLGYRIRSVFCRSGRRHYTQSLSEDVAILTLEWDDGLLAVCDVPSGVNAELFGIEIYGSKASVKASMPKGDVQDVLGGAVGHPDHFEEFGYVGTMKVFLEMCHTRQMPIPFEESEAIARVVLAARASAASGNLIMMDEF